MREHSMSKKMDLPNAEKSIFFNKSTLWQALFGAAILPVSAMADGGKYGARVQAELKGGNKRGIARPAALIPLYQTNTSLIHLSLIGLADTKSALEGNVGVGFRNLVNDNIFGAFAFYDVRKSQRGNTIHQATLGAEWFREYLEFRANVYLPQNKVFNVASSSNVLNTKHKGGGSVDITSGSNQRKEKALAGFDLDVGTQIPGLEDLTTRLAYYRFGANDSYIESRNGVRGVLGYKVADYLQLDAEASYDNQRKWTYFAGVTLGYNFDKDVKHSNLTRLEQKMTSIPIRDIDAVVGQGTKFTENDTATINGMTEDTTILIADEATGELILLDLQDGKLRQLVSTLDSEDTTISSKVDKFYDQDIITDPNTIVLHVDASGRIHNINEYTSEGLVSGGNRFTSQAERDRFASLVNSFSKSARNISANFDPLKEAKAAKAEAARKAAKARAKAAREAEMAAQQAEESEQVVNYNKKELSNQTAQAKLQGKIDSTKSEQAELMSKKAAAESRAQSYAEGASSLLAEKTAMQTRLAEMDERVKAERHAANAERGRLGKLKDKVAHKKTDLERERDALAKDIANTDKAIKEQEKLAKQATKEAAGYDKQHAKLEKQAEGFAKNMEALQAKAENLAEQRVQAEAVELRKAEEQHFSKYHKKQTAKQRKAEGVLQQKQDLAAEKEQSLVDAAALLESAQTAQAAAKNEHEQQEASFTELGEASRAAQEAYKAYKKATNPGFMKSRNPEDQAKLTQLKVEADAAANKAKKQLAEVMVAKDKAKSADREVAKAEQVHAKAVKAKDKAESVKEDAAVKAKHYQEKVEQVAAKDAPSVAIKAEKEGHNRQFKRNVDKREKVSAAQVALQTKKFEAEQGVEAIESSVGEKRRAVDEIQGQIQEMQGATPELEEALNTASETLKAAKKGASRFNFRNSKEKNEEIAQAQADVANAKQALAANVKEQQQKAKEQANLEKQIAKEEAEAAKLTAEASKLDGQLATVGEKVEHYKGKLEGLEQNHQAKLAAEELRAQRRAEGMSKKHVKALEKQAKLSEAQPKAEEELARLTAVHAEATTALESLQSKEEGSVTKEEMRNALATVKKAKHDMDKQAATVEKASKELEKTSGKVGNFGNKHQAKLAKEQAKQEVVERDAAIQAEYESAGLNKKQVKVVQKAYKAQTDIEVVNEAIKGLVTAEEAHQLARTQVAEGLDKARSKVQKTIEDISSKADAITEQKKLIKKASKEAKGELQSTLTTLKEELEVFKTAKKEAQDVVKGLEKQIKAIDGEMVTLAKETSKKMKEKARLDATLSDVAPTALEIIASATAKTADKESRQQIFGIAVESLKAIAEATA